MDATIFDPSVRKVITIMNLMPVPTNQERRPTYPHSTYTVPARKGDGIAHPGLLRVGDAFQTEATGNDGGSDSKLILASKIALDLVESWTARVPNVTDHARPPVVICEGDAPTEEEKREAWDKWIAYCNFLVTQADQFYREQKLENIGTLHKVACEELKRKRDWNKTITPDDLIPCLFCRKEISSEAFFCPNCDRPQRELTDSLKQLLETNKHKK